MKWRESNGVLCDGKIKGKRKIDKNLVRLEIMYGPLSVGL